jgi:N6-adenosine-specific RNA methylase IME4
MGGGTVKYRTIVADPPWRYQDVTRMSARTAEAHYPTMKVSEIAALPVAELAEDNAHLYMWVTNPIITEQRTDASPLSVVRAWGFEAKTLLTWVKPRWGMGFFYRGRTEHVIFEVRGTLPIPAEARETNVFEAPTGAHSQKPDSFLDMVERISPGPYLELFARRQRFGWDTWGNEALQHVELTA